MKEKIIEIEKCDDTEGFHQYQFAYTNITRERIIFAILPIFYNKKIYWLKKIKVKEQKYHLYRSYFDEWDYKTAWEYRGVHWARTMVMEV